MAGLILKNITKKYNNNYLTSNRLAVSNLSLEITDGEFMVFTGPRDSGKSTLLRIISGLERISSGELYIDNTLMNNVPPQKRNVALIFKDQSLYPSMNVYSNLAFGLRLQKITKTEISRRVQKAVKLLDIEDTLSKIPRDLSEEEVQCVLIGRAVAREPKVYLFDEPFCKLDTELQSIMREKISKLHNELKATFAFATRDRDEAMSFGASVAILNDGAVQQIDTPAHLYNNPANSFVAGFIGTPKVNKQ